jgi:hypothetical protein
MKNIQLRSRNIAILLISLSLILYGVDYLIFGRVPDIAAGFLGNFAFLPVYVLFVTLVIERVIKERERDAIRQKLNMVIGLFFSEVGTELLRIIGDFLMEPGELIRRLKATIHWSDRDFKISADFLACHELNIDSRKGDLSRLKDFLTGEKGFLLGLLQNPNLLEHDEFTDLLWGVTHLLQELEARKSLTGLPNTDFNHLSGDISRAYALLLREWLVYMKHLKTDYPFLYSLAVRMNPMDPDARPEVM